MNGSAIMGTTCVLAVVSLIAATLWDANHSNEKKWQWIAEARAKGCHRTGYHPDDARIALWTCPDGNVYKHIEPLE